MPPPKKTHHTTKKAAEGAGRVTITHPFHPDSGKEYDYVCKTKYYGVDYVTCADAQGKRSMFPMNITNLHIACGELNGDDCVMTIENLMSLRELMDGISSARDV